MQPWRDQLLEILPTLRPETGAMQGLASDAAMISGGWVGGCGWRLVAAGPAGRAAAERSMEGLASD